MKIIVEKTEILSFCREKEEDLNVMIEGKSMKKRNLDIWAVRFRKEEEIG